MLYSFNDAKAEDRHTIQYFEMFGNRGIYYHGWTAVTRHSIPWELTAESTPFNEDVWELYDTNTDWTQAHDLAAEMPDDVEHLYAHFLHTPASVARYAALLRQLTWSASATPLIISLPAVAAQTTSTS